MAVLASVVMPFQSGMPKDVAVNNWVIGGVGAGMATGDRDAIITRIRNFYTTTLPAHAGSLEFYLSPAISRVADACEIKLYDLTGHLDGSPHGSPFFESPFTPDAAGLNDPMPEEVAVCLTLEAAGREFQLVETADGVDANALVDRPRQRYTGRLYLGPFNPNIKGAATQGMARPSSTILTALRNLYRDQAELLFTDTEARAWFGVWSRVNENVRSIANVVTDDAFDTMRSRGASATVRTRTQVFVTTLVEPAA